jgi:Holliday junction DNA helicase RuvA
MYDYIKGKIAELRPAEVVIEAGGVGYSALISLQTYDALQGKDEGKIYIYHHLAENIEEFFGFATLDEREMFKLLISVNGIGVGTARVMLSSLSVDEVRSAILTDDVTRIKSVKGIGLKTAQRVIIDLKDKIEKGKGNDTITFGPGTSSIAQEAENALLMLGFAKQNINKVLSQILKSNPGITLEDLIKEALKKL